MIILIIILFVVGLIAILLEAVMPFGISAIAGILAIGFSGYLAIDQYGLKLGAIYCLIAAGIAVVVVRFAVKSGLDLMTLSPPGRSRKKGAETADRQPEALPFPSIGEIAKVVQPLRPTGTIEWEGQRLPARATLPEHEYSAGTLVRIDGKDSIFWVVGELPAEGSDATEASENAEGEPGEFDLST